MLAPTHELGSKGIAKDGSWGSLFGTKRYRGQELLDKESAALTPGVGLWLFLVVAAPIAITTASRYRGVTRAARFESGAKRAKKRGGSEKVTVKNL